MDVRYEVLGDAARLAREFVDGLAERHVGATAGHEEQRARLRRPLTDVGEDPRTVIADLAADADAGLAASGAPLLRLRRRGHAARRGRRRLAVSAWDQNANGAVTAPALAAAETVTSGWVLELLGLASGCGVGFVTGCQMAHVTCLAAARRAVLADAGWDVEADGLQGAPELCVVAGADAHVTVARACRILGLGAARVRVVPADDEGRMIASELGPALREHRGPTIVCAQAGNVNSGAFDPLEPIVQTCREHGAWCHVDGAFGLWAAVSPTRRQLLHGFEQADSWATDGHKWLNVPYDCGIAIVADAAHHVPRWRRPSTRRPRPARPSIWTARSTPEFSRRARAVPLYAALRALGRSGVTDLVDRCCDHARRMATLLAEHHAVEILNDVALNQVLVRFGASDDVTNAVIERVQRDGTCWAGGRRWHGQAVMRISVVGWQTTTADADRCADAILAALDGVIGAA